MNLKSLEITDLLISLSNRRPVFWSEADLQHELAMEIRSVLPDSQIRLEWQLPGTSIRALDILVRDRASALAIELKYTTKKIDCTVGDEHFQLRNQGAQDVRRYDVYKDVSRVEEFCACHPNSRGLVVLLTNDSLFWTGPSEGTNCSAFSLRDERIANGSLRWGPKTGPGTMKGRESDIELLNSYRIEWAEYSDLKTRSGRFRYTVFDIDPEKRLPYNQEQCHQNELD